MSLVDYAIAARRRRVNWRTLRVQPGLLLAWTVTIVAALMAIAPQLFTAYNPLEGLPGAQRLAPQAGHWLGTDQLGRDLWSRIVYGAVHSLSAALAAVAIGLFIGTALGTLAGALAGRVESAIMRLVDVLLAIPSLLLSLTVIILLGFGTLNAAVAVGVAAIASFARLARAEVVRVRHSDFVEAAYGSGGTFFAVFWRHILPNSLTAVLAFATLQFGQAILALSTLSFLGYGTPPPVPEWGLLIAEGRNYLSTAWWLTTLPGLAVIAVVHAASFAVKRGEMLAFVGESGSGKTTTAQAIIGLLADNARRDSGRISINGEEISGWSAKRLDGLRGARISLVPQDPGNSLNPVKTIGAQVGEILRLHQQSSAAERKAQVLALLAKVGLSHPEQRIDQYPHQLSGGMKQRVLIAIAIALKPDLIIADEPTSALDVTVQKRILDLLDTLRRESGTAVLFVTHDLALAAERADRLLVFRHGEIQEQGATGDVVRTPQHAYTRQLLSDLQGSTLTIAPASGRVLATPAIRVEGISKRFSLGRAHLQALDAVSFEVKRGSTHALVGESGSGKTTLARILLGFEKADVGHIAIDGIDAGHLSREALRQLRRKIQFVYQNPFASLDPRQTLFEIIEEPLKNFDRLNAETRRQRVETVAARVALAPELLSRTARELSGGQRQRVAIARALILEPTILVLDEATSALDVTVQAQILALLQQLQQQLGLSYLFITHDLATVRRIAHSVTVLRAGQVVEHGDVSRLFSAPQHDYTRELIAAIPHFSSPSKEVA